MVKRILVILTGGTIGSRILNNQIIDVNHASAYRLISLYHEKYGQDAEFEVVQPFNVLSENMTPSHWDKLCRALEKVQYDSYEGIIVTHGSDTLPYTSALVGMLFHHVEIPIVLVAGNYALEDKRSNGLINFRSAVQFIKEAGIRGVVTIYQGTDGTNNVYLPTRIEEADSYLDSFQSYGGAPFGRMEESGFIRNDGDIQPTIIELNNCKGKALDEPIRIQKDVLLIRPYPGMCYDYFQWEDSEEKSEGEYRRPAAVLHGLYHSSTACMDGEDGISLQRFIERCKRQQIDFYVCPFKDRKATLYKSSSKLLKAGAIPLFNMSLPAAYAKLLLAYNGKNIQAESFMERTLYFEELPPYTG